METSRLGAQEVGGSTYGELYSTGPNWQQNGGTRFMRYEEIPFWQHRSSHVDTVDSDIEEETLGSGSRELGTHVRRWDMSRFRDHRAEESRRLGALQGYVSGGVSTWND